MSSNQGGQRQRRKVLTEEEYTATLSSIVQRDYFPDLPDLERQVAVLERRSQGDVTGAVAIRRAARKLVNHKEALEEIEANDEHDLVHETAITNYHGVIGDDVGGDVVRRRRARPLHQESITGFHARVTNEDDEEFDSNQKQEIKANRERLENLFRNNNDNEKPPPLMITNDMASDNFEPESNRISASEWNKPKVRNALFLPPTPLIHCNGDSNNVNGTIKRITNNSNENNDGSSSSSSNLRNYENQQSLSTTTAMSSNQQQLALMQMLPPPARKPKTTSPSSSTDNSKSIPKHSLVEYIPKHTLEKKIEPSQTRFPDTNQKIIPAPNRSLLPSTADNDMSETDGGSITDASTDLDAPMRSIEDERKRRERKLNQNQQSYVAMTPLVVPGGGNTGNGSPITTWGTIDSTPMILSGREHEQEEEGESSSTSAASRSFTLSAENERDKAARKAERELARRAKRAKANTKTSKASSSSSSSCSRRDTASASLTPAARSLLERTSKGKTPLLSSSSRHRPASASRDAFASALRSSYTPKLSRPSSSSSSRRSSSQQHRSKRSSSDSAHKATPLISRTQK